MMNDSNKIYTYRCGEKIELEKSPDQMVVRMLPDELVDKAIIKSEQVSSASTRVTTSPEELEGLMTRNRELAPTHHAYFDVETGKELLTSDRILVTFVDSLTDLQIDEFAGHYALVIKEKYTDRDYLFQLTNYTGLNPVKLVVKLMEDEPLVENAELDLNQRMNKYQFSVPVDPEYLKEWHLHTSFNDPDYDTRSCSLCEDSWRLLDDFGSEDVVIAVTDDGCKLDHHDFDLLGKFADWGYFRGTRLIHEVDWISMQIHSKCTSQTLIMEPLVVASLAVRTMPC